jgi:hypothetical protein
MTPTLPDGWSPQIYDPIPEKDRNEKKEIKEPTPVKLVKVAKFYFKDKE